MKDEHKVRSMLDVDIPGKRRTGRTNLLGKDACKRDMTEVALKEDNTTNRAAWRNIRQTGVPATPDDGTSQRRRLPDGDLILLNTMEPQ